jgi:hypothetical protein
MAGPSKPRAQATPYLSQLAYNPTRIHAAALYCSDGRVGEHFDDFLHNGLSLPRYDRVALPGGPACLAGYSEARLEEQGVVDELRFLIDAHGLSRIVLIAHDGCAFYGERLRVRSQSVEQLQRADLVRAAYAIRNATSLDNIEAYYLRRRDNAMLFEPVDLD